MPEDQGVNGDRWNDQFTKLLLTLNWISVGDSNMDLENDRDKKHGVDRLFRFQESLKTTRIEAALVEAKCYQTTSYRQEMVGNWVNTLDTKLTNLKSSEKLMEKFKMLGQGPFRTGIIAVWFSDFKEYQSFRPKFIESMGKVKLNQKKVNANKIYVLENDGILRLASLAMAVDRINATPGIRSQFQFYYPSIDTFPATRSEVLNPNYFMAKFVLGEFRDKDEVENRVVFYFGRLDLDSFKRLQQALARFAYLDEQKPLTIYTYQRDSGEFRKISPEIEPLFGTQKIYLKTMENMIDLPTFMID